MEVTEENVLSVIQQVLQIAAAQDSFSRGLDHLETKIEDDERRIQMLNIRTNEQGWEIEQLKKLVRQEQRMNDMQQDLIQKILNLVKKNS